MNRQVYGWRSVIGYIHASHGMRGQEEQMKMAPLGVVFQGATMLGPLDMSPEGMVGMFAQIEHATKMVALAGPDMIIQDGVPISIASGIGTDKRIIALMEKVSGLPCTTQITAVVEALRFLEINKILVITGYFREEINKILYKFMEESGFTVVSTTDLGIDWHNTADTSPYAYYRPAKALYQKFPEAQAVVICGGSTLQNDVIEPLETDLGIPVITQKSAALWQILKMMTIRETLPGLGMLLMKIPRE